VAQRLHVTAFVAVAARKAQVSCGGDDNKALPRWMPVPSVLPTKPSHGVLPAWHETLRVVARARLLACLVLGLLWPALAPLAWDAERMLAAAQKLSPHAVAEVRELQPLLTQALSMDDAGKLQAINRFFNQHILFRDDQETWGQLDYWASPLESLSRGQGDCEDYVIAKYFSLLAVGMPMSRLRLVYVRAQVGGPNGSLLPHMVLAYYAEPGAEPTILDNLISELRPASRRLDLVPVFSFNSEGLWQGVGSQGAGDPTARRSRWPGVLAKARTEGFQ